MTEPNPADVTQAQMQAVSDWDIAWQSGFKSGQKAAANEIERLRAAQAAMREALNAIIDRGPERDAKWIGMTAKDIACFALSQESADA